MTLLNNILLNEINSNNVKVLLGDININIVGVIQIDNEYLDTLFVHGFKYYINVFTRTPSNVKNSCLDHIFVKSNNLINKFEAGVIQTSITDHFSTILAIPMGVILGAPGNNNFKIINFNKLNSKLESELWEDLYHIDDVNKFRDIFYDKIDKALQLRLETRVQNTNGSKN